MKQQTQQLFSVKIGTLDIELTSVLPSEELFIQLVADQINKKFNEIKQQQVDTMRSYAHTLLEVAKEKFSLEKKIEEKIYSLESKITSLIEEIEQHLAVISE